MLQVVQYVDYFTGDTEMRFMLDTSVSALGLSVCVLKVSELTVKKTSSIVEKKKKEITRLVRNKTDLKETSSNPHLLGYCELYERVGAGKEKLISSCEGLINLIIKNGRLPTINTVVDLYNCVSALHCVTIGAHDAEKIEGDLRVVITSGEERFIPLGTDKEVKVRPGEYAYMDDKDILCRLDVRQCEKTKVSTDTKEVIIVANSNPRMPPDSLLKACLHVCQLMETLLGAEAEIMEVK